MNKVTTCVLLLTACTLLLTIPAPVSASEDENQSSDPVSGYFRYRDLDEFMRAMAAVHGVAVRWTEGGQTRFGLLLSDELPNAEHGRGKSDPLNAIASKLPQGAPWLTMNLQGSNNNLTIQVLMFSPAGFMTTGDGSEDIRVEDDRIKGHWTVDNDDVLPGTFEADLHFDLPLIDLD